jgi:hypothetical protein
MLLDIRSILVPLSGKNIQIIRFGDSSLSYNPNYWQDIFIQIIDQLSLLK